MFQQNIRLVRAVARQATLNQGFTSQVNPAVDWDNAQPYEKIPKPGFSTIFQFLPGGELHKVSLADVHKYFHKKCGNLALLKGFLGRPDFVMAFDPDDFAKIFRTEGIWPNRLALMTQKYHREKLRPDVFKTTGLTIENGERWQEFRTIVNPVMMQPKVVELYIPRIDKVTRDFIELTKRSRDSQNETPADFGRYIQRWALEAIGEIALDKRLGVLEKTPGNKGDRLADLVDQFFELSFELEMKPSLWLYITTPKFAKLMKVLDETTNVTLEYVEEAVQNIESSKPKPVEEQGILEKLLKIDKTVAIVNVIDMLAAGIDTTSSATKALLYLLAKNSEKQKKLRQEILSILPTKDTPLTAAKLKHLPYLRACMKEAHRVLPIIAGTVRAAGQDLVLQGYRIPKGTYVGMASQLLCENEEVYPKANQFIPERWLKDDSYKEEVCKHAKDAHPFAYLPFGFGSRMCVGKRFAELEIATFIIRFIREFEVEWHHPDLKVKSSFVVQLDGDMKFRLIDCK